MSDLMKEMEKEINELYAETYILIKWIVIAAAYELKVTYYKEEI